MVQEYTKPVNIPFIQDIPFGITTTNDYIGIMLICDIFATFIYNILKQRFIKEKNYNNIKSNIILVYSSYKEATNCILQYSIYCSTIVYSGVKRE